MSLNSGFCQGYDLGKVTGPPKDVASHETLSIQNTQNSGWYTERTRKYQLLILTMSSSDTLRSHVKEQQVYHLSPVRTAIIKNSANIKCWRARGEKGALCSFGGNVYSSRYYGKRYGMFFKNQRESYRTILWSRRWGIHLEKIVIRKDTHPPGLITTLFITAKTWKQPQCPSTEERIKKM